MTGTRNDAITAELLADAMHAEVDGAVPPPSMVAGLRQRAARRRRTQLAAVVAAAGAGVVLIASSVAAPRPAAVPPSVPAPTEPAVSESPEPPIVPAPRMEAATLPRGFRYWNTALARTNPDQAGTWPLTVTYARGFTDAGKPRTPIMVTTAGEIFYEVGPEDFARTDPAARWVVVGSRRVVRAVGASGVAGYHWTERHGVNVSVTGGRGVSEAELRQVVAAVRLVSPKRTTTALARLEPYGATGVLLAETRGRGSRTLGPIAVPRAFNVHLACDGRDVRIQVAALRDGTWGCADPDTEGVQIVDRIGRTRSVTITLTADATTEWAVLVTTSEGPP